jgi:hypothetical protein
MGGMTHTYMRAYASNEVQSDDEKGGLLHRAAKNECRGPDGQQTPPCIGPDEVLAGVASRA